MMKAAFFVYLNSNIIVKEVPSFAKICPECLLDFTLCPHSNSNTYFIPSEYVSPVFGFFNRSGLLACSARLYAMLNGGKGTEVKDGMQR
jgi:hypothetical protein